MEKETEPWGPRLGDEWLLRVNLPADPTWFLCPALVARGGESAVSRGQWMITYHGHGVPRALSSVALSVLFGGWPHSIKKGNKMWPRQRSSYSLFFCNSSKEFLWLLSPQGNKCWIKYNQIQTAYPMELCLMEVTQQRAKVERRKRSKMPRGMAVGLLFNTTFFKNCTCSICVSSYLSLTCASISSSSLPHLHFYGHSGPS